MTRPVPWVCSNTDRDTPNVDLSKRNTLRIDAFNVELPVISAATSLSPSRHCIKRSR